MLRKLALGIAEKIIRRRQPDFTVSGANGAYLRRWFLVPRNRFLNVYLHEFLDSDDDRALHDHPWASLSWLLFGLLTEVTTQGRTGLLPGAWVYRKATHAHRLVLYGDRAVTLFITGPRVRDWGFHCPKGWGHWRDFVKPESTGEVGVGCGE